ncbi:Inorganic triphosphatase YgiF, contains CYTH and CHAD domains [Noviherbaspirillum humi]|uniref:Inorganic triphosphatase YgiF, contains CYTH and CHAD domains n=1 Tax=Noviherbaspirillum humi TaxID=1688639 RepID=A0A239LAS2_9BURK|nr:CYTH and CHAD domain-containing protein [Noviherbaspirillum humi]SNT27747.1 Inorganic triphosphatase YgiF, contains CYTH and CHAD domains [Noviherbaspirillum humi]
MEIELKLLINPADVEKFRELALLRQYAPHEPVREALETTYYDTPDLDLWRTLAALRLRRTGDGWLQTFKAGGQVEAGLHQRHEWEMPVAGNRFDLEALRDRVGRQSGWGRMLGDPELAASLKPLFTTRIDRTAWQLRLEDGAEVELALDQGAIEHEKGALAVCEIEMELKSGNPASLFRLALQLLDAVPLQIENLSKAHRGYALSGGWHAQPVKAAKFALERRQDARQALKAIAASCLRQIESNVELVLQTRHPEAVHQARVGMRRLRSGLKLFRDAVEVPAGLDQELRWIAGQLGAARDWEVFAHETLPAAGASQGDAFDCARLQRAALAQRDTCLKDMQEALKSPRYARLMLSLAAWLLELDNAASEDATAPLRKLADRLLARSWKRMGRRGKRLEEASPQARHAFRIAAKRLRYASEFFASLYPERRVRAHLRRLSALQDELGRLNDAAVAAGLLPKLQAADPALAADAGFVRGFLAALVDADARRVAKRWRKAKQAKPFFERS